MQYTRAMIDLIMELRRRVDAEMKPSVKLANPEVLRELAEYYPRAKDTITKTLIKELLSLAGAEWSDLLNPVAKTQDPQAQHHPHKIVKVYRGQTMLVDAPEDPGQGAVHSELVLKEINPDSKPQRMYRGQPVL